MMRAGALSARQASWCAGVSAAVARGTRRRGAGLARAMESVGLRAWGAWGAQRAYGVGDSSRGAALLSNGRLGCAGVGGVSPAWAVLGGGQARRAMGTGRSLSGRQNIMRPERPDLQMLDCESLYALLVCWTALEKAHYMEPHHHAIATRLLADHALVEGSERELAKLPHIEELTTFLKRAIPFLHAEHLGNVAWGLDILPTPESPELLRDIADRVIHYYRWKPRLRRWVEWWTLGELNAVLLPLARHKMTDHLAFAVIQKELMHRHRHRAVDGTAQLYKDEIDEIRKGDFLLKNLPAEELLTLWRAYGMVLPDTPDAADAAECGVHVNGVARNRMLPFLAEELLQRYGSAEGRESTFIVHDHARDAAVYSLRMAARLEAGSEPWCTDAKEVAEHASRLRDLADVFTFHEARFREHHEDGHLSLRDLVAKSTAAALAKSKKYSRYPVADSPLEKKRILSKMIGKGGIYNR